jgi:hypothetical protein
LRGPNSGKLPPILSWAVRIGFACSTLPADISDSVVPAPELVVNLARKMWARPRRAVQIAYPPIKIDGAQNLLPGSVLNFTYPTANDPAILVRAQSGEYFAQ